MKAILNPSNLSRLQRPRHANVLVIVLAVTFIIAILAAGLMQWGMRANQTGATSRDHLICRLLADSAVDEMFLNVQQVANDPSEPFFLALRSLKEGTTAQIPGLTPITVNKELRDQEKALKTTFTLVPTATIRKVVSCQTNDPVEVNGIITFQADITMNKRPPIVERVRMERSFQVSSTGLPYPLDQMNFFVNGTNLPSNFTPGSLIFAGMRSGPPRTLLQAVTSAPPDGIGLMPSVPGNAAVLAAIGTLTEAGIRKKAQYFVKSSKEFQDLVTSRLSDGQMLSGVVLCSAEEFLGLPLLPKFRGRCLIYFAGPVEVGEVTMEDNTKDSLVIVSPKRIVVKGRKVEAALVSVADPAAGITFVQRSVVWGPLLSSQFPRRRDISQDQLKECQFGITPALDPLQNTTEVQKKSKYIVTFSAHPISLQHRRDGKKEDWSNW
jgi:Tfp pilus assembly protein PilX